MLKNSISASIDLALAKGAVVALMFRSIIVSLLCLLLASCSATSTTTAAADQGDENAFPEVTLNASERKILDDLLENMVVIPAGTFVMGDSTGEGEDDELPLRTVTVKSFAISRYEVTFEQYDLYARMTEEEAPKDRWGRERRPVMDVTWNDTKEFTRWVSQVTGTKLRLPSEAEWEYVARAGAEGNYSFGNDVASLCDYANVADSSTDIGWRVKQCSDGYRTTAPVGSFKPNAFGVYDMHGNVWEWLEDCWYRNYRGAPDHSAARTKGSSCSHAQRGGSWFYGAEEARSSYRARGAENEKSVTLGFRLARD